MHSHGFLSLCGLNLNITDLYLHTPWPTSRGENLGELALSYQLDWTQVVSLCSKCLYHPSCLPGPHSLSLKTIPNAIPKRCLWATLHYERCRTEHFNRKMKAVCLHIWVWFLPCTTSRAPETHHSGHGHKSWVFLSLPPEPSISQHPMLMRESLPESWKKARAQSHSSFSWRTPFWGYWLTQSQVLVWLSSLCALMREVSEALHDGGQELTWVERHILPTGEGVSIKQPA